MKIASIAIGNNVLETFNNMWTGVETVRFNGVEVSRQFNWFVGIHEFQVLADDGINTDYYRVEFRCDFGSEQFVKTDVFRNGECLLDQTGRNHRYATKPLPALRDNRPSQWNRPPVRQRTPAPLYREEDLV